jgi:putative PIG3 family NAD(P)H quinone oxidoreductase
MKGYVADRPGGPEVLQLIELEQPRPAPEEVLVRVTAVGVNRLDTMQRAGNYPVPKGASQILGVECAGEVVELGSEVERIRKGTRVFCLVPGGAYAEYVVVHHEHVVETPDHWSDAKAAAVIETFCTAHETVFELGQLKKGERALIHAAGSAVGTTAIQMAAFRGAEVVGTAGNAEKVEGALRLGARHALNYRTCDFADALSEIYPDGIDFVEDFIGPAYFTRHLRVLRWLGRMTMVGLLTNGSSDADTAPILGKMLSIKGFTLRPQNNAAKAAIISRLRKNWMPHLVSGEINPVIYAELRFSEAIKSHRILDSNENFGKVVMTL